MSTSSGICNLTVSANRLHMGERAGAPHVFTCHGLSAEIMTSANGPTFEARSVERDVIYVVIAGWGILASGDEEIDITDGDVLFASAGVEHHFERLSAKFTTWKIVLRPE